MNLLSGSLALGYVYDGELHIAAWLVFAGAFFDFIDGLAARMLRVSSPLGLQLDSLSDVVTFGVAPGAIMMTLLHEAYFDRGVAIYIPYSFEDAVQFLPLLPAMLLTLFAALRLGKFNIDTRQTDSFIGLPTPAMAVFVVSLPMVLHYQAGAFDGFIKSVLTLYVIVAVLSYLMVSELRLFSMKVKDYGWQRNKLRYLFLLCSIIAIIFFKFAGLAFAIILYIGFSIINNITSNELRS